MRVKCDPCVFLGLIILAVAGACVLASLYTTPFCSWYGANGCDGRALFELAYFLTGGPLLLIAALMGLRQLALGRESLRLTEQATQQMREIEGKRFAAEVARHFIATCSPSSTLANEKLMADNDRLMYNVVLQAGCAEVQWFGPSTEKECLQSAGLKKLCLAMNDAINALDLFAGMVKAYPEQERYLFDMCAGVFLHTAAWAMPVMVVDTTIEYCPNMMSLLHRWSREQYSDESGFGMSSTLAREKNMNVTFTSTICFKDTWEGHPPLSRS